MATTWVNHIPDNIQLSQLERGQVDRLGGAPPVRIIPERKSKTDVESSKTDTVTIKLNGKAKQTFACFSGGTAEEALRHVRVFWSVEAKKEYRKNWQFAKKVKEAQKDVLKNLTKMNPITKPKRTNWILKLTSVSTP